MTRATPVLTSTQKLILCLSFHRLSHIVDEVIVIGIDSLGLVMLATLSGALASTRFVRACRSSSHIGSVLSDEGFSIEFLVLILKDALSCASIVQYDIAQVDIAELLGAIIVVE